MKKTATTIPFWEDMRNPVTMQKILRKDPAKLDYNRKYYKRNLHEANV